MAIYYRFKPFLPHWFRMKVRKAYAHKLRQETGDVWPIDKSAGEVPDDWPGWPEGKKFAFVLTHDVESLAGRDKVKDLAKLEMKLGLRSSFNFVPEGPYRVPRKLRDWLTDAGFEVGVHDLHHNGRLYDSREGFSEKAEKINHYIKEWGVSGFRSAFMLRELNWIHELDVEYDSSTFDTDPFEPQADGCGSIFPFWFPSPEAGREGYVEIPYTLPQDSTLFLILGERNSEIWFSKLKWLIERGGLVLINIHPDYIDFKTPEFSMRTYPSQIVSEFLSYVCTQHAGEFWNPLPKELARWFRGEVVSKRVQPPQNSSAPTAHTI